MKNILYGTGNYLMHCGGLTGKEVKQGEDISICTVDSFCYTVETNTTL